MASKDIIGVAPSDTYPVRVQIKGLDPEYGNEGFFILHGTKPNMVEWSKVTEILEASGMTQRDAEAYVEGFAEEVTKKEFAKVLAERITFA